MSLAVLDHPLGGHLMAQLRDRDTEPSQFRVACRKITLLLAIEATRTLSTRSVTITTPLESTPGIVLDSPIVAVPILRAGLGMLDAFSELFTNVSVGYIGLERNEDTAVASSYYAKLPPKMAGLPTFLLDPMLATGGSASSALTLIEAAGAGPITMICVVAAPEGVALLGERHPNVHIVTAALDRELNARKYILPGLGDFGDRLYGTLP